MRGSLHRPRPGCALRLRHCLRSKREISMKKTCPSHTRRSTLAVRDFGVHFEPYASVEPVGAETLVNTTIAGTHSDPRVAADAAGNYVVVWSTPVSGGASIVARMYNADGTPRTNELTVASGA